MEREPTITGIGAAIALAAIALATAPAAAFQPAVAVTLTHDNGGPAVQIGDSVTWTLTIALSGFEGLSPSPVVESINMALNPSDPAFGWGTGFVYNTGFNGGTAGGAMTDLGFADLSLTNSLLLEGFGAPADHANPLVVGTFTTTADGTASLTYSLGTGTGLGSLVTVGLTAFSNTGFALADGLLHLRNPRRPRPRHGPTAGDRRAARGTPPTVNQTSTPRFRARRHRTTELDSVNPLAPSAGRGTLLGCVPAITPPAFSPPRS